MKLKRFRSLEERPLAVPFIVLSLILVTILDLFTPLGVSSWIFFIIPLLIAYLGIKERYIYAVVIIITLIIIIDSFFKTRFVAFNIVFINRLSGIIIFFVLASLFVKQKKTNRNLYSLNLNLETRVKERTEELEKSREKLDILNKELAEKVQKLNESNSQLETMAYSVTRVLREPLRHIYGNAEMLKNLKIDEQNLSFKSHHLDLILDSSLSLSDLIEDLATHIEIGEKELKIEEIDTNQLVYRIKEKVLLSEPEAKKIEWKINDMPKINGDTTLIELLYESLILNAVRFTGKSEQGTIEIGADTSGDASKTIFYIKDNGLGFSIKENEKIFSVKVKNPNAESGGLSIGLATVKRIVEKHKGRVWAESEPGKGAKFYFEI